MQTKTFAIEANIIDVLNRKITGAKLFITDGRIDRLEPTGKMYDIWVMPGFVDAHIHIESSMLTPYEFARVALAHGTVATVSDPHEIANVNGLEGVYHMLENALEAKLKFHFGAPSCVPATSFETAGAALTATDVETLLKRKDIWYLSEMMNYPGVLFSDEEVLKKIAFAKKYNKPVDGHAPGLRGADAEKYIKAGISTDHECFTKEEATDKLKFGMKIIIREGSAAKNFEALHELISEFPDMVMLCSDDKHPDDLLLGHVNQLVARAVAKGHSLMDVLQCACVNPVKHYKLPVGLLQPGDAADFIVTDDLKNFTILKTYINGELVAENKKTFLPEKTHSILNNFSAAKKTSDDFKVATAGSQVNVIEALDGQLITNIIKCPVHEVGGYAVSSVEKDVLKITVVSRYSNEKPSVAFIKNFGLRSGAIASTVAHDSHNIIAVGVSDEDICAAVNLLIENKGGLSVVNGNENDVIALPIAGLMSNLSCEAIGNAYAAIDKKVKHLGCKLRAPYMTLSFMALLVIPDLKLSDKGLFSGKKFEFMNLFEK